RERGQDAVNTDSFSWLKERWLTQQYDSNAPRRCCAFEQLFVTSVVRYSRGPAMSVLRLAVLGTPEVFHDETRLSFALRKAQALLLYLGVEKGLHPRSKLAALLWPDSEPADARRALRNALTLLRSTLPDSSSAAHSHLHSERELLGLSPQAPLELDLDVVQQAWQQALGLSAVPPEEQRASLVVQFQHALSLVRGPFLDGFWLREDTG